MTTRRPLVLLLLAAAAATALLLPLPPVTAFVPTSVGPRRGVSFQQHRHQHQRQQYRQREPRVFNQVDEGDAVKEEERMGPGAPEGYWKDAENIKRELQVFFTVREAEERRVLEKKATNPLRSYLGLSDEEQKRIRRRDSLIDRDLYSDLRRYGFDYLVLPIMEQGGFRTFQQMLSEGGDQPPREEEKLGLALGRALEEKLSTLSKSVAADPPASSSSSSSADGAVPASQGERLSYMQDDAAALDPTTWKKGARVSAEEEAEAARQADAAARAGPPVDWGKRLALSNPMKLYLAALALGLAVGFGKATTGAVDHGLLTLATLDSVRLAGEAALVANLMSAPLAFLLLLKADRPMDVAMPMAVKALVAGPVALVEYRLKGEFQAGGGGGGGD